MKTEQEKADCANPWPEDSEQCPDYSHGQIETTSFGQGSNLEIHAWCVGLNSTSMEDADEDDADQSGCGWCGIYKLDAPQNK